MSLQRCKQEHTWTEYLVWQTYLNQEFEKPSLTDHYLMQIACVLVNIFSGKGSKRLKMDDFKLKFRKPKKATGKLSLEQRVAQSKAAWFAVTGYKRQKED